MQINIAEDFSKFPCGVNPNDSPYCGSNFRDNFLLPALDNLKPNEKLTIQLDGTLGYGSSWIESAFQGIDKNRIKLVSDSETLKMTINRYMKE